MFSHGLDCDVDYYTVNDYVGFGLMDASKMVSLAAYWSTVPDKSSCTIERIGVRKYVENVFSKQIRLLLVNMINMYIFMLFFV